MKKLLAILLAITPLFYACKKDKKNPPAPVQTCSDKMKSEYLYQVFYKGELDTNFIISITGIGNTIGFTYPYSASKNQVLILDCVKQEFTIKGWDYPQGKIYGMDSMVIEKGDYKRVYINRKYHSINPKPL